MMKKTLAFVLASILGLSSSLWASNLTQPQSTLYPYQNSIELADDFLSGGTASTSIGTIGWTSSGTITVASSETNRLGITKIDTSAVISTLSRINFNPSVSIDPALSTVLRWVARLNTNDANTTIRLGAINATSGNPPANGIYVEKLDADTNWFCVTRAGAVQTRTDSTVAVTTNFATVTYTRNTSGVQFAIDNVNVCSLMTTNIPTTFISPSISIINSAAAAKTVDVDYFSLKISELTR